MNADQIRFIVLRSDSSPDLLPNGGPFEDIQKAFPNSKFIASDEAIALQNPSWLRRLVKNESPESMCYIFLPEASIHVTPLLVTRLINAVREGEPAVIYDKIASYPMHRYDWFRDRCLACRGDFVRNENPKSIQDYASGKSIPDGFAVLKSDMDLLYATNDKYCATQQFPEAIEIEPTNACNFRCGMCPFHGEASKDFNSYIPDEQCATMNFATFARIIDEIHDCHPASAAIIPQGWGEPLAHPQFIEMIRYIHRYPENYATFSTNGALLEGKLARQLIESQLHSIIISLHANTRETARKLNMGARFEKVERNIRDFVKLKKEMNSTKPEVRLKFVELPENKADFYDYLTKWISPDIPVVSICKADRFDREKNFCWTYHELFELPGLNKIDRSPCSIPNYSMSIFADGTVRFCYGTIREEFILGNIKDSSVKDLIYSTKRLRLLKECNNRSDLPEACQHCQLWLGNTQIKGELHGYRVEGSAAMLSFYYK